MEQCPVNSSFEHQEDIDARALIGSFKLQLSQDKNSESQENTRALSLNGLILPDQEETLYQGSSIKAIEVSTSDKDEDIEESNDRTNRPSSSPATANSSRVLLQNEVNALTGDSQDEESRSLKDYTEECDLEPVHNFRRGRGRGRGSGRGRRGRGRGGKRNIEQNIVSLSSPVPPSPMNVSRKRNTRCKVCGPCLAKDCGRCVYCLDKPKFGGPNKKKLACLERRCINLKSNQHALVHVNHGELQIQIYPDNVPVDVVDPVDSINTCRPIPMISIKLTSRKNVGSGFKKRKILNPQESTSCLNESTNNYQCPPTLQKIPKMDPSSNVVKEGIFAFEGSDDDSKPFSQMKSLNMQRGYGGLNLLNPPMPIVPDTVKDEKKSNVSSCRTPIEVLRDCLSDSDWMENVTKDQKKDLMMKADAMQEIRPFCDCVPPGSSENGPYYIHLGHDKTREGLRKKFEKSLGVYGEELRVIPIRFTGKEGRTSENCPIAKWILRRPRLLEKYLVVVKERFKHTCDFTWVVIAIISWDGIPRELADRAYNDIATKISQFGTETARQCSANKKKTCACQGFEMNNNGASYTFGCSWTMYHNICKFCRSSDVHKFKLTDETAEGDIAHLCEELIDYVVPAYAKVAPESFKNMALFENIATACRIGAGGNQIFSGLTCVCDFCAHAHKDTNNMLGGATAVVTLLREEDRDADNVEDEQFHVLPLYVPHYSKDEQDNHMANEGLAVLDKFTRTIVVRETNKSKCDGGKINAKRKLDGTQGLDGEVGETMNIYESDCLKAFDDPNIGGVAFALPHGSILIECAKQELHATTALKEPSRSHPHRIGLIFYQHKNLHHPKHGADEFQRKKVNREFRDYLQYL